MLDAKRAPLKLEAYIVLSVAS